MIYNPRAGKVIRSGGALIERAGRILTQQGHNLTVAPTTGPRMAGALAREHIAQGADLIVVAGGDGTINEVAEGMVGTDVPLAILPAGRPTCWPWKRSWAATWSAWRSAWEN